MDRRLGAQTVLPAPAFDSWLTWTWLQAMSLSYAASFWPVPFFSQIQSEMAVAVGAASGQGCLVCPVTGGQICGLLTTRHRITSVFITSVTIAFMVCGANSDLFGRRYFILPGHVFVFVGAIVGGTSHSMAQTIVAHVVSSPEYNPCLNSASSLDKN
jgi:hypothetical protein